MTDPQLVTGFDPAFGPNPSDPRYTLRIFYRPQVEFPEGRPWALCLSEGVWTSGGQPANTLENLFPNHENLAVLVQGLYQDGFAIVSMGYTLASGGITGGGAFDPDQWVRAGSPPESFLRIDSTTTGVRCAEKDIVHAIQRIRRTGLGVNLDTTNEQNGVVAAQAGATTGLFCALGPDRSEAGAEPGTSFAQQTRLGWSVLADPFTSFEAWVDSVPIRHLTDGAGSLALNIGAARAAADAEQTFRDASALWYGYNFPAIRARNSQHATFITVAGTPSYTGALDWPSYQEVLSDILAPSFVQAIEQAQQALDTEFGSTFQATNSRFYVNDRQPLSLLGSEQLTWVKAVSNFNGGNEPPPPPEPEPPDIVVGFDPEYGQNPPDERYNLHVWFRSDIPFAEGTRPWVLWNEGGAFLPGSGIPFDALNFESNDNLAARLYNEGWAFISGGYTITDATLPNFGVFRPDEAFQRIGTGSTSYLLLDEDIPYSERCAERDVCHQIQRIRMDGLNNVGGNGIFPNLDTRPGRGAVYGQSAGCAASSFAVLGPNRSDPDALPGSRYAISTRVGAFVARSTVLTWACYFDGITYTHMENATGTGPTTTIGAAKAAQGDQTFRDASALWFAFQDESMRALNASLPIWSGNQADITYTGPLDYDSYQNAVPTTHPSETVQAIELAFQNAWSEAGTTPPVAYFRYATPLDEAVILEEQLAVVKAGNPALAAEPVRARILRDVELTCRGIRTLDGFRTNVNRVQVGDVAALKDGPDFSVFIKVPTTDMDGEGQTITRGIRHSLYLELTLVAQLGTAGPLALEDLIADVTKALYADRTRGGNAVHTVIERADTSYGDGDQVQHNLATMQVRIEARTSIHDLSQAI